MQENLDEPPQTGNATIDHALSNVLRATSPDRVPELEQLAHTLTGLLDNTEPVATEADNPA